MVWSWVFRAVIVGLLVLSIPQAAFSNPRIEQLVELLSHESYRVRAQAALSLGRVGSPDGVAALVAALDDGHPMVRAAAACSLGRLGAHGATARLRALATDPGQPEVVVAQARYALSNLGT